MGRKVPLKINKGNQHQSKINMNYKQASIFCFFCILYSFISNAQEEVFWHIEPFDEYVQVGYDEYCNKSLLTKEGYPISATKELRETDNFFKRGDHLYFASKSKWTIDEASAYWVRSGDELKTIHCNRADTLTNELILAEIRGDYAILDTNGRVTRWIKGAKEYSGMFMDGDKLYATSSENYQTVELDKEGKPIIPKDYIMEEYLGKGYWICARNKRGYVNFLLDPDRKEVKGLSFDRHNHRRGSDYLIIYMNPNDNKNPSRDGDIKEEMEYYGNALPDRLSLVHLETQEVLLKGYASIDDLGNQYFLVRGGSQYRLYNAKKRKFSKLNFEDYLGYGIDGKVMLKKYGKWGMLDVENDMALFVPFIHRGNKDYLFNDFGKWIVNNYNPYSFNKMDPRRGDFDRDKVDEYNLMQSVDDNDATMYVYNGEGKLIKELNAGDNAYLAGDCLVYSTGESACKVINNQGKDVLKDKSNAFQVEPLFCTGQQYNFFLLDQENKRTYTVFDANEEKEIIYQFDELKDLEEHYKTRARDHEGAKPILRKLRKKRKIGCLAAVPHQKELIYLAPKYTKVYCVLADIEHQAIFLVKQKSKTFWVDPKGNKVWDKACSKTLPEHIELSK